MSRVNLEIDGYEATDPPTSLDEDLVLYLVEELRRLQLTIEQLVEASMQTAQEEPDSPRRGTVRYNLDPWNPLGDGLEGPVMYDGTSWVAINARA